MHLLIDVSNFRTIDLISETFRTLYCAEEALINAIKSKETRNGKREKNVSKSF